MPTLQQTLTNDLKSAMRSGERQRRDTLRMVLAAIKQVQVDQQRVLDDKDILHILQKEAKKRQETIADYAKAGRSDDAGIEHLELEIIREYLPTGATPEEISSRARAILDEQNLSGSKALGQLMRILMAEFQGRADGRLVNQIVRDLLSD